MSMLSTVLLRAGNARGFRTAAASIALCASSLIVADAAVAAETVVDLLRLVPAASRPGLTLLPTAANVHGRSAYIIEIRPVTPKNMKPADLKKYNEGLKQYKQFPRFLIDRQNFSLLQYSLFTTAGG